MGKVKKAGIVIVGAGTAGMSAIEEIRKHHIKTPIYLIEEDPNLLYFRASLKHLIKGYVTPRELQARPRDFLKTNKVVLFPNRMIELHPESHKIVLNTGLEIPYIKLLLAIGAHPKWLNIPGHQLTGVFVQRTMKETIAFMDFLSTRPKNIPHHVVIVGAGVLGLELAESLASVGYSSDIFTLDPILIPKMLDYQASTMIYQLCREHNVNVHFQQGIREIIGDSNHHVSKIISKSGDEIQCSAVFFCVGIQRDLEQIQKAGIKCGQGIQVNEYLQTIYPDVYAAGDCAEYLLPDRVSYQITELWGPSGKMGAHAAQNICISLQLSSNPIMQSWTLPVLHSYSILWQHNIHSIGLINPPSDSSKNAKDYQILTDIYQSAGKSCYIKVIFHQNRIVGVLMIGEARDPMLFEHIIRKQIKIPVEIKYEEILSRQFDLERLLLIGVDH